VDEGHTFFKRTSHPDEYDRIAAAWRHSLQTGEHFHIERRIRRATGIHDWSRTAIVPTRDSQGRVTGWYGASVDVDAYRHAEVELRERERELLQLVNMVPSHLWRLAPDGEPIFFSKRMVDFLGLDVADMDMPGISRLEAMIKTVHPDELRRCLSTGESFTMRYRLRRVDGVYRWMSSRAEPMQDQNGRIVQWYGLCHDIDDQVHAEEALRRSERQLQQLIDAVPVMIWSTTHEGRPSYVNKRFTDVTGAALEDITAPDRSFSLSVIHPDDKAATAEMVGRSFRTGIPYVTQYRQLRRGGSYRWTETRAEALRDDSGNVLQWYGVSVDIHDLITAQEALRARERELSQLVDMLPVHIRRLTPEGETIFFNKRLVDFVGVDLAELHKRGTSGLTQTFIHPDDAANLQETIRHSLATGEGYATRYRVRRADGVYRWMEGRGEPVRDQSGAIVQWYGISIDIDDEVHAQAALRESERSLRELIETAPARIWCTSPDGMPIYFSRELREFYGFNVDDKDEPGSPRLLTLLRAANHPDEVEKAISLFKQSVATGEPFHMRRRQRRFDGEYRWVETHATAMRNADGAIVQWNGVNLDIHDLVVAQEALRERERELSQLVDMVPVYIRRLTPEGEPIFFNKRLTDFIGMGLAEIGTPGMSRLPPAVENFIHPDESAKLLTAIQHSLATGEGYAMKYRMRRADGVYRWIETRAEPVRNQDGTIAQWYAISIDVDDEVRAQQAEEALRATSDKLAKATQAASLAELSASIAHEVNQPLAAIVANSHACQRWLAAEPANVGRAKITVERIIRDANSAAEVVSRIRALFKQSVEPRDSAPLSGAIAEARSLMAEEAGRRRVLMEIEVESNLPLVAFDRVQIQQVLINLIRNGFDAMDATSDDRVLGVRVRRHGHSIQTEISDRGTGVEFPDKIFEPFFTTKQNGMGMGLAICRSIVESHGGRLWVEKNQPHGATFIFTLPVEVKTVS
jgi:PAS domain S-box-containing protein